MDGFRQMDESMRVKHAGGEEGSLGSSPWPAVYLKVDLSSEAQAVLSVPRESIPETRVNRRRCSRLKSGSLAVADGWLPELDFEVF